MGCKSNICDNEAGQNVVPKIKITNTGPNTICDFRKLIFLIRHELVNSMLIANRLLWLLMPIIPRLVLKDQILIMKLARTSQKQSKFIEQPSFRNLWAGSNCWAKIQIQHNNENLVFSMCIFSQFYLMFRLMPFISIPYSLFNLAWVPHRGLNNSQGHIWKPGAMRCAGTTS